MRILIIEDEIFNYKHIASLLNQTGEDVDLEGPLTSVEDVIDYFERDNIRPDLIISDIKLSDGLVFDAFVQIRIVIPVIFTTAYDDYAIRAFKYNSIDYLLKPIHKEELKSAISKYRNMSNVLPVALSTIAQISEQTYRKRILCPSKEGVKIILVDDISYIQMDASIVTIYLKDGHSHYKTEDSLTDLEKQLDPNCFYRANRLEIIQICEIADYNIDATRKTRMTLKSYPNKTIIVSKERFPGLKKLLDI